MPRLHAHGVELVVDLLDAADNVETLTKDDPRSAERSRQCVRRPTQARPSRGSKADRTDVMAKGKLEAGDEVDLRVAIERVWPDAAITIFIKSATAGGRLTLLDDRDIIVPSDAPKPSGKPRRLV
jgi:hypothetical protein